MARSVVPANFLAVNRVRVAEVAQALARLDDQMEDAKPTRSVVILTALAIEYDAVTAHLPHRNAVRAKGGTRYEFGHFEGDAISWRVATAEIAAGNVGSAIEATKAIERLERTSFCLSAWLEL